jgi:hypothetical protein
MTRTPEDETALVHRLWMRLRKREGMEGLHHHDIVSLVFRRWEQQIQRMTEADRRLFMIRVTGVIALLTAALLAISALARY